MRLKTIPIIVIQLIVVMFGVVFLGYYFAPPPIIMSYFVSEETQSTSSVLDTTQQLSEKINNLNVIAYAFLLVNPDGRIILNQNDLDKSTRSKHLCKHNRVLCKQSRNALIPTGNLAVFASLRNRNNTLKKTLSFGGADDNKSFFYAIHHQANFIHAVMTLIQTYGFSGVDLDFEINRPYRADEAKLYAELVAQLRKHLGDQAVISLATIIDTATLQSMGNANWKVVSDNVSFVSMMCYDLVSSKPRPAYTGFASNLYLVPNAPPSLVNANISCDKSIQYLISLGVPAHKIVLGIPAYAVAFGGVGVANDGLFQVVKSGEGPAFDDMGKGLLRYRTVLTLNSPDFQAYTSQVNGVVNGVWLLNAKAQQFITFDNPDSVKVKMDYIANNKLAGVMMWRIGQDVAVDNKQSLLRAVVSNCSRY